MAAHENLSGQLSMFIPARELMNYTAGHVEEHIGEYLPLSQSPNVQRRKLEDSKYTPPPRRDYNDYSEGPHKKIIRQSLYDNIKKNGVSTAIDLRLPGKNTLSPNTQIWDGNHRVVAANDIDPNMEIPVRYS